VQWSGWARIRAIDEHTKLARAALDFSTDLDFAFNINVAKMRVSIPPQLRQMLTRPINELCSRADDIYRKTSRLELNPLNHSDPTPHPNQAVSGVRDSAVGVGQSAARAGMALRSAALQTGTYDALRSMASVLNQQAPEMARALALDNL
jgi:hypothetical protein